MPKIKEVNELENMSKYALELAKAVSLLATMGLGWKLAIWIITWVSSI